MFKIITNNNLDRDNLDKIIKLKEQHWPYGYSSQLSWMKQNIKDRDLHVLMFDRGYHLNAYLNLVNEKATINDTVYRFIGIGNVCVDKAHEHNGLGQALMKFANQYLIDHFYCGLLLCKPAVLGFYLKSDWTEITPNSVIIDEKIYQGLILGYNLGIYKDAFINAESIILDRSF